MPDAPLKPPREYRELGITTPQAAAEYSADIIGFVSCHRAHDSAELAEREGRHDDARFYRAMLDILLEWYNKAPEPVTGDEDLPKFPPDDDTPEGASPPITNPNYPALIPIQKDDLRAESPAVLAAAEKLIEEHGLDDERAFGLLFQATNDLSVGVKPETVIQAMEHDLKRA